MSARGTWPALSAALVGVGTAAGSSAASPDAVPGGESEWTAPVVRYLPLVGIGLFLLVGFVWRTLLQYRRHGKAGVILFRSTRTAQRVCDAMFLVLIVAAVAQTALAAFAPERLVGLYLLPAPVGVLGVGAGALLLLGGTVFMVAAQLHLGASWRIGIEEGAKPGLVTGGLYTISRNPIFLGMFVCLVGLVVLLPTWVSAAVLVGAVVCVRYQVTEEEAYLAKTYGDAYREYAGRVGRFLPGIGRLR